MPARTRRPGRHSAKDYGRTNGSGSLQEGGQGALAVERHQVVATTDMGVADEDLRNGTPARAFHHGAARDRIGVDTDFLNILDPLGLEDLFGTNAIRANGRRVHGDVLHEEILFKIGAGPGTIAGASRLFQRKVSDFPCFQPAGHHLGLFVTQFFRSGQGA